MCPHVKTNPVKAWSVRSVYTKYSASFSSYICNSQPVFLIKYCHKLCIHKGKWWFNESMSVTFCMESTEKMDSFTLFSKQSTM